MAQPLPAVTQAPLPPTVLTGGKLDDLRNELKKILPTAANQNESAIALALDHEAARYEALASVLAPGTLSNALAERLQPLMKPLFDLNAVPEAEQLAHCRIEVESILANRAADARGALMLLHDPAFRQQVAAGSAPAALPETDLSADKQAELRKSLLGNRPDHPEPSVHVEMTALGHRFGHQALARLFDPAAASDLLSAELAKALPRDKPDDIARFATDWLNLRSTRAEFTARALALDAPFMKETLALGDAQRRTPQPDPTPAASALPDTRMPAPASAVYEGKLGFFGRLKERIFG